jgi:hypothetical protein
MAAQHPGISGARPHEPDTSGSQAYGTRA